MRPSTNPLQPHRAPQVGAVLVSFRPDLQRLEAAVSAIIPQVGRLVVVDNGSGTKWLEALEKLARAAGFELLALRENKGIAAAQNLGAKRIFAAGFEYLLLLDHDSVARPDMVEKLLQAWEQAEPSGHPISARGPVGAIGALGIDGRAEAGQGTTGGEELVYVARTWGPRRISREEWTFSLAEVAFLVASGTLLSRLAFEQVGPMNAKWFIDHIDLEWGLRARRRGFRLLACNEAIFDHQLGDEVVKIPGRENPVHVHSPFRVFYLVRNTLWLMRSGLLGRKWRWGYLVWLVKYCAFNLLAVPSQRRQRWSAVGRGLRAGVGRLP